MKKITINISDLDPINDALLIGLINQKINKLKDNGKNIITDKDISNAKRGIERMLICYQTDTLNEVKSFQKINNILHSFDCDHCKYAITVSGIYAGEIYEYKNSNPSLERCTRCSKRCDVLSEIIYSMQLNIKITNDCIVESVEYNDIIKTKALINILKTKLKNYETSKH